MNITVRLGILVALLAVGLGGQTLLGQRLRSLENGRPRTLTRSLKEFPRQIDGWVGHDEAPRKEVLEMMKLDDHLQRVYRHPSGLQLILWVSHSATSRDAYHYPTVCMQGHGWEEEESERTQIDVPIALSTEARVANVPQSRFRFVKDNRERQYVYYWYYLIGESQIDQAMRRLSQSTRLFLRGRTNASVTVEVFSSGAPTDTTLMDQFAAAVAKELESFLPEGTRAECELGANL